jgi:hypothetical protein
LWKRSARRFLRTRSARAALRRMRLGFLRWPFVQGRGLCGGVEVRGGKGPMMMGGGGAKTRYLGHFHLWCEIGPGPARLVGITTMRVLLIDRNRVNTWFAAPKWQFFSHSFSIFFFFC